MHSLVGKEVRYQMPLTDRAPVKQSLAEDEKEHIRKALAVLDCLTREHPTVPAQALRVFLLVALEEGLSMSEYQEQSGLSQSVTSRYLLDIGDRNRYMQDGFGWITQRMDPLNRRRHQALLTGKGKALAHAIVRCLRGKS